MIKKGGLYLDIQVIGGTVSAFFIFFVSGIYRATLTIVPNLLGSKSYAEVWSFFRSLVIYIFIVGALLAIPLILYPKVLYLFFDASSKKLFERVFGMINHWVWLYLMVKGLQTGLCGIIIATRDLKVQFCSYLLTILTSFLPIYVGMGIWGWRADKLWLILAIEHMVLAAVFFYRLCQKKWAKIIPSQELALAVNQNKPI
jgi:Na+-driven multidrug efflux pump